MIDKKKRREKTKELHNTPLSTLTLAALCQKVKEPRQAIWARGKFGNPHPKTGQEGFHRVLLNHHQEHATLTEVFSLTASTFPGTIKNEFLLFCFIF